MLSHLIHDSFCLCECFEVMVVSLCVAVQRKNKKVKVCSSLYHRYAFTSVLSDFTGFVQSWEFHVCFIEHLEKMMIPFHCHQLFVLLF